MAQATAGNGRNSGSSLEGANGASLPWLDTGTAGRSACTATSQIVGPSTRPCSTLTGSRQWCQGVHGVAGSTMPIRSNPKPPLPAITRDTGTVTIHPSGWSGLPRESPSKCYVLCTSASLAGQMGRNRRPVCRFARRREARKRRREVCNLEQESMCPSSSETEGGDN